MAKKLYLLDGTALVYRAFFALQRIGFTNKKAQIAEASGLIRQKH